MRKHVWAALCGALVAACGGGGGGGPTMVAATMGVNSANQDAVARTSASAMGSIASAGTGVTASSGGAGVASLPGASRQVALALTSTRKATLAAGRAGPLATRSETAPCAFSGTVTVTVNDANNNNQGDAGDSLTFTFTNCKVTAADNANGSIAITLSSFAATPVGANFAGTMTLNLVATEGTRTATLAGTVAANFTDLTTTQSRTSLTIGAGGLTGSVTAGGTTETITYENGFALSETETIDGNGNPLSTSTTVSGAISSSVLAGRIVLETTTPIVHLAADAYPGSGMLRATGTSGSALRVTALNNTQVQLDLDADGNGTYEASKTVLWTTVLPG